jgi:nucleoside-diphosphate-sugar epimerase
MKILITGASGSVGSGAVASLSPDHEVASIGRGERRYEASVL